ncbi:putative NTP binding protein (contains STAS domain) [Burkholderiales bacterium JOSHI_001]|nr:putative NTP binding protein (contains STAS domain) [Burkholderiales bacterium JOSHI_001]
MLVLPATLTLAQARDTLRMLEQSLRADADATLTVDASALQSFDTSAVAVLLACRRLADAAGKGFALSGVPRQMGELIRLYGVASLLSLASEPEPVPGAATGAAA